MSVLVTGGAGFIGSYVTRSLLKRGEKVIALDLNFETTPLRRILTPEELERVVQVRADVADSVAVFRAVRENDVSRIVHLAMVPLPAAQEDPWKAMQVNVEGTQIIFEAARVFGLERVVWASSVQVFGRHTPYSKEFGGVLTDNGPQRPWSVYSACKAFSESMCRHYHHKFDADIRGVRPCGTFGPGRQGGFTAYLNSMIQAAVEGRSYTIPNGEQAQPMIYVEDSARAFEVALYHDGPELTGRTVNMGGHQTTNRGLAELVRKVIPEAEIAVGAGDGGEPVTLPIDNSTLSRATGFRLEVSMEEGVRRTAEFFRESHR